MTHTHVHTHGENTTRMDGQRCTYCPAAAALDDLIEHKTFITFVHALINLYNCDDIENCREVSAWVVAKQERNRGGDPEVLSRIEKFRQDRRRGSKEGKSEQERQREAARRARRLMHKSSGITYYNAYHLQL